MRFSCARRRNIAADSKPSFTACSLRARFSLSHNSDARLPKCLLGWRTFRWAHWPRRRIALEIKQALVATALWREIGDFGIVEFSGTVDCHYRGFRRPRSGRVQIRRSAYCGNLSVIVSHGARSATKLWNCGQPLDHHRTRPCEWKPGRPQANRRRTSSSRNGDKMLSPLPPFCRKPRSALRLAKAETVPVELAPGYILRSQNVSGNDCNDNDWPE
jgi:hypothetical protein